MRAYCVSDTHGKHGGVEVPDCDLLLYAGDATLTDRISEFLDFKEWLHKVSATWKVVVLGNHDYDMRFSAKKNLTEAHYLDGSSTQIGSVKIWGSPLSTIDKEVWRDGADLKSVYDKIPDDTDLVLTHSPPKGILDRNIDNEHCGAPHLLKKVLKVKPRYHVFGHIHEGYGELEMSGVTFINCSVLDDRYRLRNQPVPIRIGGR